MEGLWRRLGPEEKPPRLSPTHSPAWPRTDELCNGTLRPPLQLC